MVDGVGASGMGTGPKLMSFNGTSYTLSQVERQGQSYGSMLGSLRKAGNAGSNEKLFPYLRMMSDGDERDFLAKRLLIKDMAEKYGVTPSQKQVEDYITNSLFADQNGEFDQVSYTDFIEKRVKRYGLGVQDFNIMVGEVLSLDKLQGIVGSGLDLDEEVTRESLKINAQEMTYEQFTLPVSVLKEGIQVSDEEVKAYWEENKQNYLTEPEMKVQYVLVDAEIPVKEAQGTSAAKEKARKERTPEEEIGKIQYTLSEEEKNALIDEVGIKLDTLFVNVQDNEGKNFTGLAKELSLEVKTSDFFKPSNAPFELKLPLYQEQGTVLQRIAGLLPIPDSMESISDVYSVGEGKFMLVQLLEKKEEEPLAFEKAKARAQVDLQDDRAKNSLNDEVTKVREKLITETEGKNASEVAKELNLTYHKRENVKFGQPLPDELSARDFFTEAIQLKVNEFSEPIIQMDEGLARAVILRPLERRYVNSEENKASLESQLGNTGEMLNMVVFENWFNHQLVQASFEKH